LPAHTEIAMAGAAIIMNVDVIAASVPRTDRLRHSNHSGLEGNFRLPLTPHNRGDPECNAATSTLPTRQHQQANIPKPLR
jgi:hypothetical protein